MKNIKRRFVIFFKRNNLFKAMKQRRLFNLLNKATSVKDTCFTSKELNYIFKTL